MPASMPSILAGFVDMSSTSFVRLILPERTSAPWQTENAVSKPVIPNGAASKAMSFSVSVCGAWSVAMTSIVPSETPSIRASTSCLERSGGHIL